jgi:hypothetical protein
MYPSAGPITLNVTVPLIADSLLSSSVSTLISPPVSCSSTPSSNSPAKSKLSFLRIHADRPLLKLLSSVWTDTSAFRSKSAFIWAEDGSSRAVFTDARLGHLVQLIPSQPLVLLQKDDATVVDGLIHADDRCGSIALSPLLLSSQLAAKLKESESETRIYWWDPVDVRARTACMQRGRRA